MITLDPRRLWLDSARRVCGARDLVAVLPLEKAREALARWVSMRPGLEIRGELSRPDPRVKLWVCDASLEGTAMRVILGPRYGTCWYVAEVTP